MCVRGNRHWLRRWNWRQRRASGFGKSSLNAVPKPVAQSPKPFFFPRLRLPFRLGGRAADSRPQAAEPRLELPVPNRFLEECQLRVRHRHEEEREEQTERLAADD